MTHLTHHWGVRDFRSRRRLQPGSDAGEGGFTEQPSVLLWRGRDERDAIGDTSDEDIGDQTGQSIERACVAQGVRRRAQLDELLLRRTEIIVDDHCDINHGVTMQTATKTLGLL